MARKQKPPLTFGEKLRAWRARHGFDRVQASQELAVKRRSLEGWETGRWVPTHAPTIERLMILISEREANGKGAASQSL